MRAAQGVRACDAGCGCVLAGGVFKCGSPGRGGRGSREGVSGGVLLSHTLPGAVPSALWVLASGFGMGPGVPHDAITTETL